METQREVKKRMKKEKELLRQQLQLLAEQSKTSTDIDLSPLSNSMNGIYTTLMSERALLLLFLIVSANLFKGILVHIKNLFRR